MSDCRERILNIEQRNDGVPVDDCGPCDWKDVPEEDRGSWRPCPHHHEWKRRQYDRALGIKETDIN
jgi:hypothetical protein